MFVISLRIKYNTTCAGVIYNCGRIRVGVCASGCVHVTVCDCWKLFVLLIRQTILMSKWMDVHVMLHNKCLQQYLPAAGRGVMHINETELEMRMVNVNVNVNINDNRER